MKRRRGDRVSRVFSSVNSDNERQFYDDGVECDHVRTRVRTSREREREIVERRVTLRSRHNRDDKVFDVAAQRKSLRDGIMKSFQNEARLKCDIPERRATSVCYV